MLKIIVCYKIILDDKYILNITILVLNEKYILFRVILANGQILHKN